ncbi:MAG TPA: putative baseplate assembly protein [Bryocella sp.]|nr:putative baseplate assembly protein [Bryocella sp.]
MTRAAPEIDCRTRTDVAAQLAHDLEEQYPGWQRDTGLGNGLVQVFARYAELVIESTNRVPDRDRVAFLSQLGGALLPPQPSIVPLTFSLAPGGIAAVVPAGTQVAAAPAPGSNVPIVFETDAELVVTAAKLDCLFVRSAGDDRFADKSSLLSTEAETPTTVYSASTPMEHMLYIGSEGFFGHRRLNMLSVSLDMQADLESTKGAVAWEIWTEQQSIALTPESDGTAALTRSGEVVIRNLPAFATSILNGQEKHWLRCRWLKPVRGSIIVRSVSLEREIDEGALLPAAAFTNSLKIDLSKDFLPLGESPRFGDAMYILNQQAFSTCGAEVRLNVIMTNPATGSADVPVPRVNATENARVALEYWNGREWSALGTMSAQASTEQASNTFRDTTQAFTASGTISFLVPNDLQPLDIGGIHGAWIRARLIANGYGEEAGYTVTESKPGTFAYIYKPRTLAPPVVERIEIEFSVHDRGQYPEAAIAFNDFTLEDVTAALSGVAGEKVIFRPSRDPEPALYLGFGPPFGLGMPTLPISIYFVLGNSVPAVASADAELQRTTWQYWNGARWVSFTVTDNTCGFAYSGRVTFLVPPDAVASEEFRQYRYWLRVPWLMGSEDTTAPLRLVLENTTSASQAITLIDEVLGSSNGAPDQVFTAARHPVLEGELLEVRGAAPGFGKSASGDWNTWQNVQDFHASGPLDTHYVLDRISGVVTFGDGRYGAIPPKGTANIRFSRYRSGGGAAGNKGVDTLVQLKTTVPYVRSVTNKQPASGGADAETVPAMLERAPRSFRHRSRAVTVEDYEDLARLASPDVARSRCIPLVNLVLDPDAKQTRPGTVSVLVVPNDATRKPSPSQTLLARVRDYIQARQSATVQLIVTSPEYVELNVAAEIGIRTLDGMTELEAAIRRRLQLFMHPLHGGFEGKGWGFGRNAHRSDLLSLVSSIHGVDHIRGLALQYVEPRPGVAGTKNFLICPGDVRLTFTLI